MALSKFPGRKIRIIGQGMEKYLTLSFSENIVFKDSCMFLSSALATLGENLLTAGEEHFKIIREDFPGMTDDQFKLLLRKGVYPYDYMNDWSRFKETKLPAKEEFYNKLHDDQISDEDYEHAQTVWKAFKCKSLFQYHQLYLMGIIYI